MRVAVFERFPEPSRNCPSDRILTEQGQVRRFWLRGEPIPPHNNRLRAEFLRLISLPGRIAGSLFRILCDPELSVTEKHSLVSSSLATKGAPLASLARAHEALQFLRSQSFDQIECYSAHEFHMVTMLSQFLGIPCDEFLSHGTRYFGEFAFELFAVVPYAYWLHQAGQLQMTQSCEDTACLYYFSSNHEELCKRRSYVPVSEYPVSRRRTWRFDAHSFPRQIDTGMWSPPPYQSVFENETFRWQKDLCVICNKYSSEPSILFGRPCNFIAPGELSKLLEKLSKRYQVVYVRPREQDIVGDHQNIIEFNDLAMINERFPDVLTIQQIHRQHANLSYNELQMRLFANCRRFVSVLGGSSFLCSYFGGKNIVYAREGWEVSADAYNNWFHRFSGAQVTRAETPKRLLELVQQEFLA